MLPKHIEKKLNRNCTRMQQDISNKFCKQHPTKQQLYSHLPPISKIIQIKWIKHVGNCWRCKDEPICSVPQRTPSHGQPASSYLQHLCTDRRFSLEDLLEAIDDRDQWWDRVRETHASSKTWWWLIFNKHNAMNLNWSKSHHFLSSWNQNISIQELFDAAVTLQTSTTCHVLFWKEMSFTKYLIPYDPQICYEEKLLSMKPQQIIFFS